MSTAWEETWLFGAFDCRVCHQASSQYFDPPNTTYCRTCTQLNEQKIESERRHRAMRERKEREHVERNALALSHKCGTCGVRFAEESMAVKNVCQGCWLAVTGSPWTETPLSTDSAKLDEK